MGNTTFDAKHPALKYECGDMQQKIVALLRGLEYSSGQSG
jgi:hypothetical protein